MRGVTFSPMPFLSPIAKKLFLVTCCLSLVTILSGCSAIGRAKPAALQITSKPEASIFLDGKHIGKTPFFSDQLKSGEHSLKISISEANYVDKITLTAGTLMVINRELAANFLAQSGEALSLIPGKEGLFITSMPPDSSVTLDGKLIGKTPILTTNVAEGDHKVLITKDGYVPREFSVKTTSSYQLQAQITLGSEQAKNIASGQLPTSSLPQTVKVAVTSTPQGFLRVRKEPSTDSPEIGKVKTGDQLEVIQEDKDWVKVIFEGKQGWISKEYTQKLL